MGPIEQRLMDLGQLGDPRARPMEQTEIPPLVEALRARFGTAASGLDLSAESLLRLETQLVRSAEGEPFSSRPDVLVLVRELVAYIGQVLALQAQGRWEFGPNLWATYIVYDRTVQGIKGRETRTYLSAADIIGNLAASSLDAIDAGVAPQLPAAYIRATATVVRERLSSRKRPSSATRSRLRR